MPAQTTIQVRRGTASSWTSTNPTLAAGEVGFETDTGKFKIGTGSAVWTSLSYFNPGNTSPLTTKGDLFTYSTTDARLPVGANGYTLVADSSTSTGLAYSPTFFAGKNKIINGDFGIWQRGTSFSNPASGAFTADRWSVVWDGSGATRTISQQTFTAGNAITGYEPGNFFRFNQSVAGTGGTYNLFQNRMEDVRTFAGQTVTISFWAKAAANTNLVKLNLEQEFGTGGSPSATVSTDLSTGTITITTSWQRFSYTTTVPSISGKTVGTTTPGFLGLRIWLPVNSTFTFDIWGVQVEAGSTATQFQTATGTIQGELAAAQRYYWRSGADSTYLFAGFGVGGAGSTTQAYPVVQNPVTMRTVPTAIEYSNLGLTDGVTTTALTSLIFAQINPTTLALTATVASGLTQYRSYRLCSNNSASGYLGISAEL